MKVCACSAQGVLPEAHPWPKWSVPTLCGTTAQLQVTRAAAHLILCSEHLTLVFFGKAKALAFWPLLIWSALTQLLNEIIAIGSCPQCIPILTVGWSSSHLQSSPVQAWGCLSFRQQAGAAAELALWTTSSGCFALRDGDVSLALSFAHQHQIFCPCYRCSSLFGGLGLYCKRNRFSSCFFWAG